MKAQASRGKPQAKTSAQIAEMMGTGRVLDAAIRRAVRQAIEARDLRRKLEDPSALLTNARLPRGSGRRASR